MIWDLLIGITWRTIMSFDQDCKCNIYFQRNSIGRLNLRILYSCKIDFLCLSQQWSPCTISKDSEMPNHEDAAASEDITRPEPSSKATTTTTTEETTSRTVNRNKSSKLQKRATLASICPPSSPTFLTSSLEMSQAEKERPVHLTASKTEQVFFDVTGVEVAPPKMYGMTIDQRREFIKCQRSQSINNYSFDDVED